MSLVGTTTDQAKTSRASKARTEHGPCPEVPSMAATMDEDREPL